MTFTEKNNRERLEFVDTWAEYVKKHSDREWSRQQNVIINSGLRSANISKDAYLKMKAGGRASAWTATTSAASAVSPGYVKAPKVRRGSFPIEDR